MTDARILGAQALAEWWEDQPFIDWYETGRAAGFRDPMFSFAQNEPNDLEDLGIACRVVGLDTVQALEKVIAGSIGWRPAALRAVARYAVEFGGRAPAAYPPDVLAMVVALSSPDGSEAVRASRYLAPIQRALDEVLAIRFGDPQEATPAS